MMDVHDDADTALMSLRIEIVEGHHIDALVAEITFRNNPEILGRQDTRRQQDSQRGRTEILEKTHRNE